MTGRVEGKVAVIAGAGTGIGRACMVLFGREGAKVVGCARTQANLDETMRLTKDAGGDGAVVAHDLAQPEGAEALIAAAIDAYGRIDILVNCASVGYSWLEQSPGFHGGRDQHDAREMAGGDGNQRRLLFLPLPRRRPRHAEAGRRRDRQCRQHLGIPGPSLSPTPTPPPRGRRSTSPARSASPTPRTISARTASLPASPTRRWWRRSSISSTIADMADRITPMAAPRHARRDGLRLPLSRLRRSQLLQRHGTHHRRRDDGTAVARRTRSPTGSHPLIGSCSVSTSWV